MRRTSKIDDATHGKTHAEICGDFKRNAKNEDAENHTLNTSQSNKIESINRMSGGNGCKITTLLKMRTIYQLHNSSVCWHEEGGTKCRFAHPVLEQNSAIKKENYTPKKTCKEGHTEDKLMCRCSEFCNF